LSLRGAKAGAPGSSQEGGRWLFIHRSPANDCEDEMALFTILETREQIDLSISPIFPPIPMRNFDWSAIDSSTYDGEGSAQGFGSTQREALEDLIEQLFCR
jgi:hypothetical protein